MAVTSDDEQAGRQADMEMRMDDANRQPVAHERIEIVRRRVVCNGADRKFPARSSLHVIDPRRDHVCIRLGVAYLSRVVIWDRAARQEKRGRTVGCRFTPYERRIRVVTAPDGHETVHLRCPDPRCRRHLQWRMDNAVGKLEQLVGGDFGDLDISDPRWA